MSSVNRVMTSKPGTVFVDKYGGAEFTVEELGSLFVSMMRTDSKETVEEFFDRFEKKEKTA